ncbi:MAG: 3-oxoacid CoA-transferase subunit B [Anaerorhabdus sp.]
MDKKIYIAKRVAKELDKNSVINLGIGIPSQVAEFISDDMNIVIQSENGIIGMSSSILNSLNVVNACGQMTGINKQGAYIDSALSFGLIRGGHIDCTVLGALEVDQEGNIANWLVPGKKISGMGGAMDLLVGAKKVIVAMEHCSKGKIKIKEKCTLPLTAIKCVDLIITEMCVMKVTERGLELVEISDGYTFDDVQSVTESRLIYEK